MCYSEESIFNQIKYPCVLSVLSAIPSNCPIGLIIATGKFNNGQHYHAKNGEKINVSEIFEPIGNGLAVPLSITAGVVGSLAFIGAGAAIGAQLGATATGAEVIAGAGIGTTTGGSMANCTTGQLALKGINGHK
jgi:hypothetical protein